MQLSARHACGAVRPRASGRCAAFRTPVATSRQAQRRLVVPQAAEETATTSNGESSAEPALSPLERAKKVLEDGTLDKEVLTAALADLESEMGRLQEAASSADSRAASLEATAAQTKDQFLRLTADFDNFRRRTREESSQLADQVRSDVIKEMLPLVDNFELARTQVKAETEGEQKINNSYQGLYKQMVDLMRSLGVEAVPTVGSPFDPSVHDAIMREPSEEHPDGTVLQEFRKGFALSGKLIRPAMVKVSYTEDTPSQTSDE